MIRIVVIDVDDTLCMTEAACFELENETLQRMGRKPMSRSIHTETWGMPLFEAIERRSPGIDVKEFRRVYQPVLTDYVESGRLDAITEENYRTLDELLSDGKRIALLTSRTHTEMEHLLKPDHPLARRVDAVYHKDNVKHPKPDSRVFNEMLVSTSAHPEECVYVGDSPGDAQAANGAGLKCIISLESGLRSEDDFANLQVDVFIRSFPELIPAIKALS